MLRYFPIECGVNVDVGGNLLRVDWQPNGLSADFDLAERDTEALRVSFDSQTIVRLLDEMPLSTEKGPDEREGLVQNHFAYRLEGAPFARMQSEAWREVAGPIQHFQFVTGWGCMDVLCREGPVFSIVKIGH